MQHPVPGDQENLDPCYLPLRSRKGQVRGDGQKKVQFWSFFCLLIFGNLLKYLYVCRQANVNRQQAQVFSGEPQVLVSADTRKNLFLA